MQGAAFLSIWNWKNQSSNKMCLWSYWAQSLKVLRVTFICSLKTLILTWISGFGHELEKHTASGVLTGQAEARLEPGIPSGAGRGSMVSNRRLVGLSGSRRSRRTASAAISMNICFSLCSSSIVYLRHLWYLRIVAELLGVCSMRQPN